MTETENIPMDAAGITALIDEALGADGSDDPSNDALFDANYHLTLFANEEDPREAKSHLVYFAASCAYWMQSRDSTNDEAAQVNGISDEEVTTLRKYALAHPRMLRAQEVVARASHPTLPKPFSKDELVVAFAFQTVAKILEADGVVRASEWEFVDAQFPITMLEGTGLFSDGEPTERFELARRAALELLPTMLTRDEKLQLGGLFLKACEADHDFHPHEIRWMFGAMKFLGIPHDEFATHLEELRG
jgi:hypothetical protein